MARRAILVACVLLLATCSDGDDGVADFIDTPGDDAPPVEVDSPIADLVSVFEAPPVASPNGESVSVTVALTNPTDEAIRLDPCPAYSVSVGESSEGFNAGPWMLNCDAVPEIDADSTELFEVVIPVPDGEDLSGYSGTWRLLPIGAGAGNTEAIGGPFRSEGG